MKLVFTTIIILVQTGSLAQIVLFHSDGCLQKESFDEIWNISSDLQTLEKFENSNSKIIEGEKKNIRVSVKGPTLQFDSLVAYLDSFNSNFYIAVWNDQMQGHPCPSDNIHSIMLYQSLTGSNFSVSSLHCMKCFLIRYFENTNSINIDSSFVAEKAILSFETRAVYDQFYIKNKNLKSLTIWFNRGYAKSNLKKVIELDMPNLRELTIGTSFKKSIPFLENLYTLNSLTIDRINKISQFDKWLSTQSSLKKVRVTYKWTRRSKRKLERISSKHGVDISFKSL